MCSGDVILQCTNLCRNGSISIIILHAAVGRCHPSKETLSPKQQVIKLNQFQASPRHCVPETSSFNAPMCVAMAKILYNSVRGIREMPPNKARFAFSEAMRNKTGPTNSRPTLDITFGRHHSCAWHSGESPCSTAMRYYHAWVTKNYGFQ